MARHYFLVLQYSTNASQTDLCLCVASSTSSHSPKKHAHEAYCCIAIYCDYITSLLSLFTNEPLDTGLLVCWIITTIAWNWDTVVLQQNKSSSGDPRQECNVVSHTRVWAICWSSVSLQGGPGFPVSLRRLPCRVVRDTVRVAPHHTVY